ncbi:MAG: D-aminoacyl-tRNA deacylase [Christensenellaceae bacterium]
MSRRKRKDEPSVKDVGGEILFVSQLPVRRRFARKSSSFIWRAPGARNVCISTQRTAERRVEVKLGIFGADMKIEQFNDSP